MGTRRAQPPENGERGPRRRTEERRHGRGMGESQPKVYEQQFQRERKVFQTIKSRHGRGKGRQYRKGHPESGEECYG